MLTRVSAVLIALFGLLPYISTIKLPPLATFWAELVAFMLAVAWLGSFRQVGASAKARSSPSVASKPPVPVATLGFVAFGAILLIQMLARQPLSSGYPMLALASLGLATKLCLAGARLRASGEVPRLLDAWSIGLLVALLLNVLALLLDRKGLFIYILQVVPRAPQERADGLIGQPNQLAIFAVIAGTAGHYMWMRGKLWHAVHLVISAAVGLVVTASASRAGLLAWVLATALSALALRSHAQRKAGWTLLLVGVAIFFSIQLTWPLWDPATSGASTSFRILHEENRGRVELLRDSWALIQLHPFTGVGFGNFMSARWMELSGSMMEPTAAHSHNLITHLGTELGVPGALLVLLPLGSALWCSIKVVLKPNPAPEQFFVIVVIFVLAGYSLLEFPLWQTYFLLPFALAVGLVQQVDLKMLPFSDTATGARRVVLALVGAFGVLVAVDYHRSESLYTSLLNQNRWGKGVPIQRASDIALLTAFDVYANLMYSRTLDMDGSFVEEKLLVTRQAMLSLLTPETVARAVAFLALAGRDDAARLILARTARNDQLNIETRNTLQLFVAKYPELKAFIATLAPAQPSKGQS